MPRKTKSTTLSVFFNVDRTYVTMISESASGLTLEFIDSTNMKIDLENMESDESITAVNELLFMFAKLQESVDRVSITVPAEITLARQFPGRTGMSEDEILQLVGFELRQIYPQFQQQDFHIRVTPFVPRPDGKQKMMSVIVPKTDYQQMQDILSPLGKPIGNIEISQFSAHNCFLFNYPELIEKNIAIVGFQGNFLDFSVITGGKPVYYNLASIHDTLEIGSLFENEINKIIPQFVNNLDGVFFFGSGLTTEISDAIRETSHMRGIRDAKRLNAFRMMRSTLSDREKEYCARTLHLYPPCIGAAMPAHHEVLHIA